MVNSRSQKSQPLSPEYLTNTLPSLLPPIFDQAQQSTANHRKNIVYLRKIHEQCASIVEEMSDDRIKLTGEKAFNNIFFDMVNRVLTVKKGVAVADRVVKFVANYVSYCTGTDAANKHEDEDDEEEADTPASRFVVRLLRHLLGGIEAKDKNVRFRVTLMIVSMINGLGEMDDDLYILLRKSLLDRSRDKEASVRVQAALGLSKLQSGEEEEDLEEGQEPLVDVLLDLLRYDPAAEVRRAALYNFPRTPVSLPHILARTRDVDPILRRTVFAGVFSAEALPDPRILTIAQREEVVRNGLGDREPSVRKAAAGMLAGWLDLAEGDLLEFLSRFDVTSSQVAEDALMSIFVTRPEVLQGIEFEDEYWTTLTPEKSFLVRVFVDRCVAIKDTTRLEESIPVVTALAFCVQEEYNKLVQAVNEGADDATLMERTFIVGELLKLAVNLDYADEIGRRKMFQLAREMISQINLPDPLIPRCLDVLSKIANGERDLIRVIVDVVTELREGEGDEEDALSSGQGSIGDSSVNVRRLSVGSGRSRSMAPRFNLDDPEERMKSALIDLRCLLICISLLERVHSTLQDNSVFHGLLPDLIIPAVRNKEEPALRDQGLICLGLCCMIDEKMAANSFGLFIQQLNSADDVLKVKVCQIIFDLLLVHDIDTLVSKTMVQPDKVVELIRHTLSLDIAEVQAIACEGVAKLMLAGMISDEVVLQSLVLLYFSPETADNQPLRQCLTYFLPVYCYTAAENQRRMLSIFYDTYTMLSQMSEEAEDDEMLPLSQIGLMMVDWIDPFKALGREGSTIDTSVHLDLSIEVLKLILMETSHDSRKALASLLSKLTLPEGEEADNDTLKSVLALICAVRDKRPLSDAPSRNAVTKFESVLLKKWPQILEAFDEDAFRGEGAEKEGVKELFGFIDDV
ncbi:mitotic chromosome condensation-related protein, putative [Cryptococcus deneoformans JEC21]|uniref:Mitotic chromosome condensation-related protein, putative n=1 Tax=Cryptococcus deneoformans (strain JEC21 / ATCC MYA-565) TaxID=214684 RepID=Q5KNG3_CRYD1|nr:mitotic chromosome condensation-related protein, putative [Cryptococcus neoformans var. neoformans JEC21]AAW41180.1 mitotic chromosome condensation-related protein, putative [Cryptococcus neoformans var. neoformans JEC21]